MQILKCERCPRYQEMGDNVASFLCGACACIGAAQVQRAEEDRLSKYTREQSRFARKEHGWTQQDLAFKLGISVSQISAFESKTAVALIHPAHAEWLDNQ